jgi:hypothetical protein
LGEIQDFRRGWPPGRRRRGWLSRPGYILLLPLVGLIGLGLYFATSSGVSVPFITPVQFAPSTFESDRDCQDFATRWEAQSFFQQAGPGDPHHLDEDGDGLVCEFNAWFDLSGWF